MGLTLTFALTGCTGGLDSPLSGRLSGIENGTVTLGSSCPEGM